MTLYMKEQEIRNDALEEGTARGQASALRTVARNMNSSGYSISEIARCLGVTPEAAAEMLMDTPLPIRRLLPSSVIPLGICSAR